MRLTSILLTRIKVGELTIKHSTLPERYIKRKLEQVIYQAPKLPQYRQIRVTKKFKQIELDRPWELNFQTENILASERQRSAYVEPLKEWVIFKGDRVEILVGKDKGKQGIVSEIIQERNWVLVKGLNTYLKKLRLSPSEPYTYMKAEAPLLVPLEVSLVDPGDMMPTKVSWRYDENGNKVRVCEKSGRVLPIPLLEEETYAYETRNTYLEKSKDTKAEDVNRVTFVPSLQTFEMEIMKEYGIEEDRVPAKIYWY